MEKQETYFLDSYALIEIVRENENFRKFEDTINFTSFANLLEVHYIITKNFGEKKADEIIGTLKSIALFIEIEDVKKASRFRIKNAKKKMSYIDCLGYAMSINRNMKFVTGDMEFENFKEVEFVKK